MNNRNNKKGFTLIELLVVMGILGILMAVTILVINPAQYLARARDTQRINDLQAVNSAIATFMANGGTLANTTTTMATQGSMANVTPTTSVNAIRLTNNTGWVNGINLSTSGLSTLPMDPTNSGVYGYFYYSNGTDYELAANSFESAYYTTAPNQAGANDGGNSNSSCTAGANGTCKYEVGSKLTLF